MELIEEALGNLTNLLSGPREMALDIICDHVESGDADAQWIVESLIPALQEKATDSIDEAENDRVFGRTFAIEVLACVMDQDAQEGILKRSQRLQMVTFTEQYLEREKDYRGFVNVDNGWAHSVAHVADLTMALFKNPFIETNDLQALLSGWKQLLISDELPFLFFDEDQRIALALKAAIETGRFNALSLAVFFDELLNDEEDDWYHFAFRSPKTLNRFKNIQNLARSLYLQVQMNVKTDPNSDVLTVLKSFLRKIDAGFFPA